ncbi:DUF5675 family protein [Nitrosomonas ureae]|uniref:DUF5675 domain-containing protein n=1 Tax=Nitrosomonas ureae TaxID=44577 RepID=A0A286AJW9_9PROT|nr:DUF5675 family protein [Nitrosomonas ureae]SOD22176.1 hypothetical protein SAMN06297164_3380 [Nitrosomonas ureae]
MLIGCAARWGMEDTWAYSFLGRYRVLKTMSQRFERYTLHIMDVPGFAGIRIHSGNTAKNTQGCVFVGGAIAENMVINSRNELVLLERKVFPLLDDHQAVFITIE